MEILKYLENSNIVKEFEIVNFRVFKDGFYMKIMVKLINNTELHIREYSDIESRDYSYHWQNTDKKLIRRWDNTPHHKEIKTYPHHLHVGDEILESYSISCVEIMNTIENIINQEYMEFPVGKVK